MSDQITPVVIWTEATLEMAMLSSVRPNNFRLIRTT
jgi:hypothetical protein